LIVLSTGSRTFSLSLSKDVSELVEELEFVGRGKGLSTGSRAFRRAQGPPNRLKERSLSLSKRDES